MFSRSAVAIFSVIVAEFFAAAWVVGQIGLGLTLLVFLGLGFLGVAVARWQSSGLLVSTIQSATNPSVETTTAVAGRALGLVAGLLISFPGFITSALGLVLLLAPVRKTVEPLLAARATSWSVPFINRSGPRPGQWPGRRGPSGDGTIIDVDLVDRDHPGRQDSADVADQSRSARPEIG